VTEMNLNTIVHWLLGYLCYCLNFSSIFFIFEKGAKDDKNLRLFKFSHYISKSGTKRRTQFVCKIGHLERKWFLCKKLILDSCTKTIFSLNGQLYRQTDGISMGSLLGPTFANLRLYIALNSFCHFFYLWKRE
jgi:hypothetical protein